MSHQGFAYSGVVEGFYGTPYSHADRLWLIDRLGAWGMNVYLYAPKDDVFQRARWREPYPDDAMARFAEMIKRGEQLGVRVGFALSPGLSIRYCSREDRALLAEKLARFERLGARFFSIQLDDVPHALAHADDRRAFRSLADAHAALASEVKAALDPDSTLWLVPTDYLGVEPTPYLETLGERLDGSVEVGWTGRTVISPEIRVDEAAVRASTLGRRLLIWDNVPVNDGPMRAMLHLGPYGGRSPELTRHASGVLLNPMVQPRASALALRTAATYLTDPRHYDPDRAWREAIEELGRGAPSAFATFAAAHRFSPLWPFDRDRELEDTFGTLAAGLEAGEDLSSHVAALRECVDDRLGASERLRDALADRALVAELEPWLASHRSESEKLDAALAALTVLLSNDDPRERSMSFMGMQARLTRIPPAGPVSYGPRRAFYPQLRSMEDLRLSDDPALVRGRSLVDEILEFVEDLGLFVLGD